jgi:hypothetical protein
MRTKSKTFKVPVINGLSVGFDPGGAYDPMKVTLMFTVDGRDIHFVLPEPLAACGFFLTQDPEFREALEQARVRDVKKKAAR